MAGRESLLVVESLYQGLARERRPLIYNRLYCFLTDYTSKDN